MSHDSAAAGGAGAVFALGALLQSTWRTLDDGDRERLLAELTGHAATLVRAYDARPHEPRDPSVDEVRRHHRGAAVDVALQPIVCLSQGSPVGFEALARFDRWTPDRWFQRAWEAGVGLAFEIRAVERALQLLDDLPDDVYLAINVSPYAAVSAGLMKALSTVDCTRIVLEVTEHAPIVDYELFNSQFARVRARGVRLAIDDVGAGHSSLQHIVQLAPDMIKLD